MVATIRLLRPADLFLEVVRKVNRGLTQMEPVRSVVHQGIICEIVLSETTSKQQPLLLFSPLFRTEQNLAAAAVVRRRADLFSEDVVELPGRSSRKRMSTASMSSSAASAKLL